MVRISVLNDALRSITNAEKRGKRQVSIDKHKLHAVCIHAAPPHIDSFFFFFLCNFFFFFSSLGSCSPFVQGYYQIFASHDVER